MFKILKNINFSIAAPCEQYDIKKVVEESKKRHPEIPYLANILEKI